ncbi:hypothetical protein Pfo_001619 [Paulownia fortunei]|nr:hypothetical protein Pfo_001619 [Paulownia fortunei]
MFLLKVRIAQRIRISTPFLYFCTHKSYILLNYQNPKAVSATPIPQISSNQSDPNFRSSSLLQVFSSFVAEISLHILIIGIGYLQHIFPAVTTVFTSITILDLEQSN